MLTLHAPCSWWAPPESHRGWSPAPMSGAAGRAHIVCARPRCLPHGREGGWGHRPKVLRIGLSLAARGVAPQTSLSGSIVPRFAAESSILGAVFSPEAGGGLAVSTAAARDLVAPSASFPGLAAV